MDSTSRPIIIGVILIALVGGTVYLRTRNPHPQPQNPLVVPITTQESTTTGVSISTDATSTIQ